MKKGKYLIFGLFPLAVSSVLLQGSSSSQQKEKASDPNQADFKKIPEELENDQGPGPHMVDQLALTNADPKEVIGILEKLTGRTALIGQKIPTTKLSIELQEAVSTGEAISALESLLSLNDIAIVDMGEKFIKAVPAKSAITQSPDVIEESLLGYEPNQKVFSKFFKLQYLDATDFQKAIKPILTPGSSNIILFPAGNSLFITDSMANLQVIESFIKRMDKRIEMVEAVNFIPLNNVKSSAVAKKIDQLKRGVLKKYLSTTTIDSDDSSNQLIVITAADNFPIIQNIVRQLDNKCELLLKSEILRIKHGDAKKIADIVSGIIKDQRNHIEKENKMAFERRQAQMTAQGTLANALAQAASGSRSNQQISNTYSDFISSQPAPGELGEEHVTQFSSNLTISSDDRSNSIIVYGTSSDLMQIKGLVANLDVLLDQVRIEVIVAQVTLNDIQQSGLDSFALGFNQKNLSGTTSANGESVSAVATTRSNEITFRNTFKDGSSFKGNLKNFALETVLREAKSNSNIKILSTPTIVTTHNRKAQFKIGETRPFVDSSTKSDNINAQERVQLNYKDVGVEIIITPLIGSNGIVQMEIQQKVSKHSNDVKIGGIDAPIITNKEINSFVSVANGDVIVLAGFREKTDDRGSGKTFLLGDLPLLGDLFFSSRKRKEETSELLVFIKPTVILQPQEEAAYLSKQLENTHFQEDIECYKATGDFVKSDPFPKDTIFGLNGQEMSKKMKAQKMASESEAINVAKAETVKSDHVEDINAPQSTRKGVKTHARRRH